MVKKKVFKPCPVRACMPGPIEYRRIVTHTDFDGVVSALLIRDLFDIEHVTFAEPWQLQQKQFDVKKGDVIVDLPYGEQCALWFDHHATSAPDAAKGILDVNAKSCARVIFEHYIQQHPTLEKFRLIVDAADKIDSASFTKDDLEHPDVYGKLSIAIKGDDKRKDDEFRLFLLNMLAFQTAEQVINQPIIRKRVEEKLKQLEEWRVKIGTYVVVQGKVIVVDRTAAPVDLPRGQPFFLYVMYPGNAVYVSADTMKYELDLVKISAGKSIFDQYIHEKLAAMDLGAMMQRYGGGGHKNAAGCSVSMADKERVLQEIVDEINAALL